jgi:outer membrane autotransporter protein
VNKKSTKVGSGTQAGFDSDTQGVAIGFDGISDNGMTVGVSVATANTDVDGKGTGKSVNSIDTYSASLYMDRATDAGYVEGSLSFGVNENSISRRITSAGLNRTLSGSYDSQSLSLNLTAGVPNEFASGFFLTPFGSFTATSMDVDAYTEKSTVANDALRLKVAQDDINSMIGTVGLKYHAEMDNGGTPMISLAINNEFGDSTIDSTNTFQGGGTAFKTSTAVEELSATLGLGYSYGSDSAAIEFAYEADANEDDYLSHYGSIKIVGKF